nr:unnamed protein product [Callosobruchus chinensis]
MTLTLISVLSFSELAEQLTDFEDHINDLLSSTTNPIHGFGDDSTLHAGIMSNRRLATAASLSKDLEAITAWGAAGENLGYLFRARKHFSPANLLTLYKAQIRPSLEYCSHIWRAAAPTTLSIHDAVQRMAI